MANAEGGRNVTFSKSCIVSFSVKCAIYKLGQNCFIADEVSNDAGILTSVTIQFQRCQNYQFKILLNRICFSFGIMPKNLRRAT